MKEYIKGYILSQFPDAKLVSGGREIVMRCRFCGDSKNTRSKHFYIKIPEDGIFLYNCFRCSESGILTANTLKILDIYDMQLSIDLTKFNKNILSKPHNRKKYNEIDIYNLHNKYITDNELSKVKLGYINKRLGLNLMYRDLLENKIVLNLLDLLNSNGVHHYTRDLNIIKELNESFIGFMSFDNAYVNMRNLRQGKVSEYVDYKYLNYNIFNKIDNSKRYYIIPTNIDILNPAPVRVHMAEGAFDILSIKYNLRRDNYHNIYSSIGGKAYLNLLKMYIQTLGLINVEFHIYIDNDVDEWTLANIYDYLKIYEFNIYVHKNVYPGEKDFGVPLSRIEERIYKL